jgi:uncharacterized SAM-binding protein YcdF (DUF218 family)
MWNFKRIITSFLKKLKKVLLSAGIVFILFIVLATTSLPFWARYQLGKAKACTHEKTATIIVMGAGGYPSESVLMRLWYASEMALHDTSTTILISTPGMFSDSSSTVFLMHRHLIRTGINSDRILTETEGLNTRHQAIEAYKMYENGLFNEPLLIVTSPTHSYRAVKCFEKVGFKNVCALPTMEIMLETDLRFESKKLGGYEFIPVASQSMVLRYKFWDYLKYEVEIIREYAAITIYWLRGWM